MDKAVEQTPGNLGAVPEWDLSDLYSGMDDPQIEADIEEASGQVDTFVQTYKGQLDGLDGKGLARCIRDYETFSEIFGKVLSFATLMYAADNSDPAKGRFLQTLRERVNDISAQLIFFTLELNGLDEKTLEKQLSESEAARYRPWVRKVRAFKPHQLSDELETFLHDKSVTGSAAWNRLFDETMTSLRFPFDGDMVSEAEILSKLSDPDQTVRKRAAKSLGTVLGDNVRLFSLITNTLAKDKQVEDKWRNFERPVSARNLSNQVEDEVVDALVSAARESYPDISHRYYALKAKWFGVDKLDHWDRNAPLPKVKEPVFSWEEAKEVVLQSYGDFSPEMADIAGRFFDNNWIDAPVREGKDSGAFSSSVVPSVHPYVLMNFLGKVRDVATLAHELGHGVHQVLAAEQGYLLSQTPLTLAETASVFGEMLTFQNLLAREKEPARRRAMLAGKVEDMINTVVRQIAFYTFEEYVHNERRHGEITPERLCEIWMEVQKESLGPAFRFDDEYKFFWTYIPHFIHTPFYVYAYAFGDCLVNALYDVYSEGHPDFQKKYLEMLKAGGTRDHRELLAPFGLDASDPRFWRRGLAVVSRMIDELEALEQV